MVARTEKTFHRVLRGMAAANISFEDLGRLLRELGCEERVCGGHHIFAEQGSEKILNLATPGQLPGFSIRMITVYGDCRLSWKGDQECGNMFALC